MTELELKEIEDEWEGNVRDGDLEDLIAEVRRYRGLIKTAEWKGSTDDCRACPWCGAINLLEMGHATGHPTLTDPCPAFTQGGEVK